ncbi:flotillin family protein [Neolewinella agarilytica]|uniref:SPFH domain / Band 7 family protein n=1 Tax=Neolewinella agarilytica TaxID=478744 RepID=A0A1H9AH55_9BACT|nr:hypothetical protein [Neolewinella agarilytica]SEP75925.1 hypothetical protein SAMN05444359_10294 [Neolewinella agarilytica]
MKLSSRHIFLIIAVIVLLLSALLFNPFSVNDQGYRTVVQGITGTEFVRFEPGMYWAGFFSKTTEYADVVTVQVERPEKRKADISYFSEPIQCQFADGTYANQVGYSVKWKLPNNGERMLAIHKDYREQSRLAASLADYSKECANYSFQLMDSERHYSGGKSELAEAFKFQLRNGQYIIDQHEQMRVDSASGEKIRSYENTPRTNADGSFVLAKSDVQQYDIVPNFVAITLVDYESVVNEKLKAKVEQSTREAIAKQELVTAQQEALTAEMRGRQKVAEVRATEEAAKIEAEIRAQAETAVSKEQALQARYQADKALAQGRADAEVARLKVQAGLSPRERAEFEKETRIGIAAELAKVNMPQIVIGGGNGKQGANPMDALGVNMLMEVMAKMEKQ